MTDYTPPLKDMLFNIHELSGLKRVLQLESFSDFDTDIVDQVVGGVQVCRRDIESDQYSGRSGRL